jgi:hypothetical protein
VSGVWGASCYPVIFAKQPPSPGVHEDECFKWLKQSHCLHQQLHGMWGIRDALFFHCYHITA